MVKYPSGMPRFVDLGSDVNWPFYGGKWGRPTPDGSEWYVVRFDPGENEGDAFTVEVLLVHLADVKSDAKYLRRVLDVIGWYDSDDALAGKSPEDSTIVEACIAYGLYDIESHAVDEKYAARRRADARRFVETRLSYE